MADKNETVPLRHSTIRTLTENSQSIRAAARAGGHDAFMPVPTRQEGEVESQARGQSQPTPIKKPVQGSDGRGLRLVFLPTREKVTLVREQVGRSYKGDWLHEVITGDGHKFLAMDKQLLQR